MVLRTPLILLATVLTACNGSETSPPTTTDAGDPLGGKTPLMLCLEWCKECEYPDQPSLCPKECVDALTDATPLCQTEVGALWACYLDVASREGCMSNKAPQCDTIDENATSCILENGGCLFYRVATMCEPEDHSPDPPTCHCYKECLGTVPPNFEPLNSYTVDCTTDLTVSQCECRVSSMLVGTCEQGPEPICDIWTSCCNQFFDLLYPYSTN
jgi:hypothetical protein